MKRSARCETVSDAITESIIELLEADDEVRQAAAERKLRKAIAPKIRDALIKHGEDCQHRAAGNDP